MYLDRRILGLFAILLTRETWGPKDRARVDEIIAKA